LHGERVICRRYVTSIVHATFWNTLLQIVKTREIDQRLLLGAGGLIQINALLTPKNTEAELFNKANADITRPLPSPLKTPPLLYLSTSKQRQTYSLEESVLC
jgi:hypothetical protein